MTDLGVDGGGMLLQDDQGERLLLSAYRSMSPELARVLAAIPPWEGLIGQAITEQQVTLVARGAPETALLPAEVRQALGTGQRIEAMVVVPLLAGARCLGVLVLIQRRPWQVTAAEQQLLNALGARLPWPWSEPSSIARQLSTATFRKRSAPWPERSRPIPPTWRSCNA